MKRLLSWWTLGNLTRVFDLALRVVGVVAAFGALNLLTSKPDVQSTSECVETIDSARVDAFYAATEQETPSVVRMVVEEYIQLQKKRQGSFGFSSVPTEFTVRPPRGYECSGGFIFAFGAGRVTDEEQKVLGRVYGSFPKGISYTTEFTTEFSYPGTVPIYARQLVIASDLSRLDISRALEALETSRYLQIDIRVVNEGAATAKEVRVDPPHGFTVLDNADRTMDLTAGATAHVALRGPIGRTIPPPRNSFGVQFERTEVVNTRALLWVSIGLLALVWLPAVVRDVSQSNKDQSHHGNKS